MSHWAIDLLPGQIVGLQTMTNFVDAATNSDKYRRFVVLSPMGNTTQKVLLTQTGRWSKGVTGRHTFGGGTWRVIKEATTSRERSASPADFLAMHVEKKIGSYMRMFDGHDTLSTQQLGSLRSQAGVGKALATLGQAPAPAAPAPTSPAPTPEEAAADLRDRLGSPTTPTPVHASGPQSRINALRAAVESGQVDEFTLLKQYQDVNAEVVAERKRLEQELLSIASLTDLLKDTLATIVA